MELAQQLVVSGHGTLALVHLNQHSRLVVLECAEDLGLLGWYCGVTLDQRSHNTSSGLETEGKRGHVQQEQIIELATAVVSTENCGLHSGTVGNGLIGVDRAVGLLTVEEVAENLLDARDTGGPANQHNLVNLVLGHLGITKHTLDGLHGLAEVLVVQLLETSTSQGDMEVNALVQGVNLDGSTSCRGKSALGSLTGSLQTTTGSIGA